jgi:hypothetical protein
MEKIILTTKLSLNDYINANYRMYPQWMFKFLRGIGLLSLISPIISAMTFPFNDVTSYLPPLVVGLFLTIGLRILIYFAAKRNYESDGRISETIIYEFNNDTFQLTGESFSAKLTWDKVYKLTESKDWVFIWQSKQLAHVIPKRDFKEGEFQQFKNILKLHSELNNKLKP